MGNGPNISQQQALAVGEANSILVCISIPEVMKSKDFIAIICNFALLSYNSLFSFGSPHHKKT